MNGDADNFFKWDFKKMLSPTTLLSERMIETRTQDMFNVFAGLVKFHSSSLVL